ncbi:MAG: hypothetical protein U5N58_08490 [Actinomycetota bacterium]|nr:hypothetical protein [Actinomycetota bacterium]
MKKLLYCFTIGVIIAALVSLIAGCQPAVEEAAEEQLVIGYTPLTMEINLSISK